MKVREGDRALITGASYGIGEAFARELAARGVDLVLLARTETRLRALAAELSNVDCTVLPCDLRLGTPSLEAIGRIDLLVNNAGFGLFGPFEEQDPEGISGMVQVNVRAPVELARAVAPQMVQRRRGGIINVGSVVSIMVLPYMAEYAASKAFMLTFSQALHAEYAARGVTVTALLPGMTSTRFASISHTPGNLGPRQTATQVAHTGLKALEAGRATAVSGWFNVLGAAAIKLTPRMVFARLWALSQGPKTRP